MEPQVRHDGGDDQVAGERAALVHRDRTRRQHLVAVDHVAPRIGEQRPVGVAVERHARVGAQPDDLGGDHVRMERAAPDVDVVAVGVVEHRVHVGTEPAQQAGCELRRRAVRAVDHDRQALERPLGRGHQMLQVAFAPDPVLAHPAGLARRPGRFGQQRLDLVLELVGELRAVAREELDAVVLRRIVRCGDHDARRRVELGREERDRRGRLHPGQDHVASRRSDAVRQRLLQPDPRATRVAPHQERRAVRAVPSQHDDGGAAQAEGKLVRQLGARDAAHPIGAEESSHGGKATRARGSGAPEPGACGSIGP